MPSSPNTLQLSPAETNNSPEHNISRRDKLRDIVQEAYSTPVDKDDAGFSWLLDKSLSGDNENEAEAVTPRMTLEALELMAFEKSDDDDALNNDTVNKAIAELKTNAGTTDIAPLEDYLDKVYRAIHRGEDVAEVESVFKEDLDVKRSALAKASHKRINSLLGNKANREKAQEEYNKSLRVSAHWELRGKEDQQLEQGAGLLALKEMQSLREATDQYHLQTEQAVEEKKWHEKARDWADNKAKKPLIEFTSKGKKRSITVGHLATLGLSVVGGAAARTGMFAALGATGGVLITTGVGAVAGGIVGGAIAGVRAQKDIKMNVRDTGGSDEAALDGKVNTVEDVISSVDTRWTGEVGATRKDRSTKVRRRMGAGAIKGAIAGGGGALLGLGVAQGIDALSNLNVSDTAESIKDFAVEKAVEYSTGIDMGELDNIESSEGGDTSSDSGTVIEGNTDTGADGEQPSSDVPEISPESTAPTTEELLQHYAGENADTAMAIESGQGPYAAFEKLGIPESQWDDLMHNEELMERLVANENAYSLDAAGIQDYGFGLSGSELSPDSIQAIYEAAGMDNIDAAVDTAPVDTNLPESYQDLPPEVQEFAQQKYDVVMNIESSMGGEKLMEALNADPQAWSNFEYDLLQAAPNDFYLMNDGHVGISHTGALSPEAIEALAKGLSQNSNALAA